MGAVMDMDGRDITPSMECRTAAAGPIVSVTACALSFAFGCLVLRCLELLKPFIYANAIIAAVNLLPCFPLDGGRMCECLLLRFLPPKTAAKICIYMGLALGAILAAVGVFFTVYGLFMPVLYMLAGFILTAAIKEIIHLPEKQVSALLTRRSAVKHGKSVAMKLSMVTYETTDEVVTAMTRQIDEQSSGTEGQSGSTFIEQRSETVQPATITTENGQEAIVLYKREPELRGVVVVAQGAADLTVRLNLQRAVQAVTGLPLCAIEVLEMGYDED